MIRKLSASLALAISCTIMGCDDKQAATPAPPAAPAPVTPAAPATPAMPAAPATPTPAPAPTMTTPAPDKPQTPPAVTTDLPKAAQDMTDTAKATAAAATADTQKQAQSQLDQVVTYIKDNKLDLAEKALSAVEAKKSSLPADWQTKVDSIRKMLDTAKATNSTGIKIPGL